MKKYIKLWRGEVLHKRKNKNKTVCGITIALGKWDWELQESKKKALKANPRLWTCPNCFR